MCLVATKKIVRRCWAGVAQIPREWCSAGTPTLKEEEKICDCTVKYFVKSEDSCSKTYMNSLEFVFDEPLLGTKGLPYVDIPGLGDFEIALEELTSKTSETILEYCLSHNILKYSRDSGEYKVYSVLLSPDKEALQELIKRRKWVKAGRPSPSPSYEALLDELKSLEHVRDF